MAYGPYEFGMKARLAVTAQKGLIANARSFPGNPCDSKPLVEQFKWIAILTDTPGKTAFVDLGYRDRELEGVRVLHRGERKRMTKAEERLFKRRQAVEPNIGNLKAGHDMLRTFLEGSLCNIINPNVVAVGLNIRRLVRCLAVPGAEYYPAPCDCWIRVPRMPAETYFFTAICWDPVLR